MSFAGRVVLWTACFATWVGTLSGCDESDAPLCSIDALQRALDDAPDGAIVSFGACDLHGSLTVPGGVELRGEGAERSRLVSDEGAALTLSGEGARASRLRVSSTGLIAIRKHGAGGASLAEVDVEVERGVGLLVREGTLSVSQLALTGPLSGVDLDDPVYARVTPGAASAAAAIVCGGVSECTPGETRAASCSVATHCAQLQICDACALFATWTATHGVIVGERTALDLVDSTVGGFAEYGVLALTGSSLSLERVAVDEILGIGVFASNAVIDLEQVDVRGTRSGVRGSTSAGVVVDQGSMLAARALRIADTEGVGLVIASSRADLETLEIERSDQEGMLVYAAESVDVHGPGSRFVENRGAGVVVAAGSLARFSDLAIEGTLTRPFFIGAGVVHIGDGFLGTNVAPGSTLSRVRLARNARAQLTVVAPSIDAVPLALTDVVVDGVGEQRGAVVGPLAADGVSALPDGAWSAGLMRLGDTAANDTARASEAVPIAPDATPESVQTARDRIGIVMPIM